MHGTEQLRVCEKRAERLSQELNEMESHTNDLQLALKSFQGEKDQLIVKGVSFIWKKENRDGASNLMSLSNHMHAVREKEEQLREALRKKEEEVAQLQTRMIQMQTEHEQELQKQRMKVRERDPRTQCF